MVGQCVLKAQAGLEAGAGPGGLCEDSFLGRPGLGDLQGSPKAEGAPAAVGCGAESS